MTIKTITAITHRPGVQDTALEQAIVCARQWAAHLKVECVSVDRGPVPGYFGPSEAIMLQTDLAEARELAEEAARSLRRRLQPEDISWEVHAAACTSFGLEAFVADCARFSDLLVLPRPYGTPPDQTDVDMLEAALFGANRPVLVVPPKEPAQPLGESLLLAWDESDGALGAIRQARSLIIKADRTDITMIDPGAGRRDRSDPGGRLAEYLARMGAKVEINVLARSGTGVAERLLRRAREQGHDMIVMGGYGHSRMREALFGGVTRSILEHGDIPVLMAH